MHIYQPKLSDVMLILDRAYFDADHGRTWLAVARVRELAGLFPNHAKVAYAEGVIRRDYLGQGLAARDCFERSAQLDPGHAFAVENATFLARTEKEFRQWAARFRQVVPKSDPSHRNLDQMFSLLDQGHEYDDVLASFANSKTDPGTKAAYLQVLFSVANVSPEAEAHDRRMRAQLLRELDRNAARHREAKPEQFPALERLALSEAIAELDCAMAADRYEAELWNLKAAWLVDLAQYAEAIQAADQAIELRPHGYPKPYHNRATAFMRSGEKDKALESMRKAEEEARKGSQEANLQAARELLEQWSAPPPNQAMIEQHASALTRAVATTCRMYKEVELRQVGPRGWTTVPLITTGFLSSRNLPSISSVHFLAETLGVYSPETVFTIINSLGKRSREAYAKCVEAAVCIASCSKGVEQWDACRLVSLTILSCGNLSLSQLLYRQLVLAPTASDRMAGLADRVSKDLEAIDPVLAEEVLNQPPLSESELEYARNTILARLDGDPVPPRAASQPVIHTLPLIATDPQNALNSVPLLFAPRVPMQACGSIVALVVVIGALLFLWKWLA